MSSMMGNLTAWSFISAILSISTAFADSPDSAHLDDLRLNEVQYIGTHNSYKLQPDSLMYRALIANSSSIDSGIVDEDEKTYRSLAYGHMPLDDQLNLGIRLFELDLHVASPDNPFDPDGWYKKAFGANYKTEAPRLPKPIGDGSILVYHVAEHDFRSTCLRLSDCLSVMGQWSEENPDHAPIVVYLEAKTTGSPALRLSEKGLDRNSAGSNFDLAAWSKVDADVRSVIGDHRLIRPGEIRRDNLALRESLQRFGWPQIKDLRGRFLFVVAGSDAAKEAYSKVKEERFFTFRQPSHPEASFVIEFDPGSDNIEKIIAANLIASTYADYKLLESRRNKTNKKERLFSIGAQMISTDFPLPDPRFSGYSVRFSNGSYIRARPPLK